MKRAACGAENQIHSRSGRNCPWMRNLPIGLFRTLSAPAAVLCRHPFDILSPRPLQPHKVSARKPGDRNTKTESDSVSSSGRNLK